MGRSPEVAQELAEIRAAEERYRLFFDSIDDGFCVIEVVFDEHRRAIDYVFLEANASFERQSGLVDVVGKSVRTLVPNLDPSWYERYGDVVLTGEPLRTESAEPAMSRWFEVYASRMGAPELARVAVVFKDVSARKTTELALRESEARFRNMADNAPVMLWITDVNASCTYLSKNWYDFTGQTEATGLGFGWLSAVHREDGKASEARYLEATARRESFRLEYRLRRHDGEYRWAIDSASPRFDAAGEFLGYIGSVIDISERKQAEEVKERLFAQEAKARKEAEDANRLKDEFLATISHELRTPLNAVLGWVTMLRTGGLPPDKHERALATVERNARVQGQLIEDLLDVSRIVSGKLTLEVEPVNVAAVAEQSLDSVRPAAEAKSIRLEATLDPLARVKGDARRLQQVVWNLLSNAVKFTGRGGAVRLAIERADAEVVVSIADSGQGIEPDFLPHLFERFRQADASSRRQHGGLGLGLSIVRQLVEMHGGTVEAASEGRGRGATFIARLPAELSVETTELPSRELLRHSASGVGFECPPQLADLRILVVDDDEDARELTRVLVESCGATALLASSAEEALVRLREGIDILLSDIGMPAVDGYELIRRVRALAPEQGGRVLAVAVTAYARAEDRTRLLRAGFQSHVAKPVEPVELLAVLASLADRR